MEEDIVKFSFEWWVRFAAIWGGALATFHALVSVIKAWLTRPRIHVTTNLTGSPEIGNQISIYNHSPIPINIHGYEICRKKWFGQCKDINSSFQDGELINLKIGAHSTKIMEFKDQNHFSWSSKARKKQGALHLKLYIDGRNFPVVKKLKTNS